MLVMRMKYYTRILFFLATSVLISGCAESKNNSNTPNHDLAMSIINHVAKCWHPPASIIKPLDAVRINIDINRDTSLKKAEIAKVDMKKYKSDKEFRMLADSAIVAIKECSPMEFLPADKYDIWKNLEATFDVTPLDIEIYQQRNRTVNAKTND